MFGMGLTEFLLVGSVILLLLSLFFEPIAFVAYGLLTYCIVKELEVHFMYLILCTLLIYPIMILVHYKIIKVLLEPILDKLIPTKLNIGADDMVGKKGKVIAHDDEVIVEVGGKFYSFAEDYDVNHGDKIVVSGFKNGKVEL